MKRNIMLIVVLGLVLYGVVAVLGLWMSSDEDAVGYSTERMVEAAYRAHVPTTYTPSAAGNSAVAVPMSADRGTPFRHTYVPAVNYTVSTPVLNGGSYASQGLMLTSQQRQQSYGGSAAGTSATRTSAGSGSSYAMGGHGSSASSSGSSSSGGYFSGSYSLGGIYSSGNTYSTAAGGGISVHGNMTSTFSPSVYASAPAPYTSFNNDFSAFGGSIDAPLVTASGNEPSTWYSWVSAEATRRRSNNVTIEDTYYKWLQSNAWDFGAGADNLTEAQIRALWETLCANNEDFALTYTYEEFYNWFLSKQGDETFKWKLPIGDGVSCLLFLCVACIVVIRCRQQKREQI